LNVQITTSIIFPREHVFPIVLEAEMSRCIHVGTLHPQYCNYLGASMLRLSHYWTK